MAIEDKGKKRKTKWQEILAAILGGDQQTELGQQQPSQSANQLSLPMQQQIAKDPNYALGYLLGGMLRNGAHSWLQNYQERGAEKANSPPEEPSANTELLRQAAKDALNQQMSPAAVAGAQQRINPVEQAKNAALPVPDMEPMLSSSGGGATVNEPFAVENGNFGGNSSLEEYIRRMYGGRF